MGAPGGLDDHALGHRHLGPRQHRLQALRRGGPAALDGRAAGGHPAAEADIRNSLVGAALGGIAITRYIWRMEPIASMSRETVVALHGPVVQGFLTGPLPEIPAVPAAPAA
ncbi:hypothetical protein [Clavibacter zhangzhiyongii]|uniref:TetR/AcrR family transcriptional regulator n=1 Tax=Clavibacter zhangzhiyongii TaxID=2768071 RepID=UPI0039E136DE